MRPAGSGSRPSPQAITGFRSRSQGSHPGTQHRNVAAGQTVSLDIQVQVAAAEERIDVRASTLQRESAELGGLVDRDLVLGLPVNGRSYEQLALLEPGVVATTSRETSVLYQHGLKININGAEQPVECVSARRHQRHRSL